VLAVDGIFVAFPPSIDVCLSLSLSLMPSSLFVRRSKAALHFGDKVNIWFKNSAILHHF
jgi:hypothetical protein